MPTVVDNVFNAPKAKQSAAVAVPYDFRMPEIEGEIRDFDHSIRDQGGEDRRGGIKFFHIPSEISESISANYDPQVIIGRSGPIFGYSSTGARVVSLEIILHAQQNPVSDVFEKIQFVKSFLYPEYVGNNLRPPRRIQVVMGQFLNVVGILLSLEPVWEAPYDVTSKFPHMAKFNLSITETLPEPLDFQTVRDYFGTEPIQGTARSLAIPST